MVSVRVLARALDVASARARVPGSVHAMGAASEAASVRLLAQVSAPAWLCMQSPRERRRPTALQGSRGSVAQCQVRPKSRRSTALGRTEHIALRWWHYTRSVGAPQNMMRKARKSLPSRVQHA